MGVHLVAGIDMFQVRHLLFAALIGSTAFFAQNSDSSIEREEAIQKTVPDRKLAKEDVQCGNYFWVARKTGTTFLYYFFGSAEWGKGQVGFYQQTLYHLVVNNDKDPPTVQRIKDAKGNLTEVRVQMTGRELAASGACFSSQ